MSLKRKINVVIGFLLLVLGSTVWSFFSNLNDLSEQQIEVLKYSQHSDAVAKLVHELRQMVYIHRLNLKTEQTKTLVGFNDVDIGVSFKQFHSVSLDKNLMGVLHNLEKNYINLKSFTDDLNESVKRNIDLAYHDQDMVRSRILVVSNHMLDQVNDLQSAYQALLTQRIQKMSSIQEELFGKFIGIGVLALVLAIAAVSYLNQGHRRMLIDTRLMIRDLLHGEFVLKKYKGKGEVTIFSKDFQDVSDRLQKAREQLVQYNDSHFDIFFRKKISDLNNSLSAIVTTAELVTEDFSNAEKARQYIENIFIASSKAADISKILSQYTQKTIKFEKNVKLQNIVNECVEMVKMAVTPQMTFRCEFSDDLMDAYADRMQLLKVLLDVTLNACEAYDGKGDVLFRAKNVHVVAKDELSKMVDPGDYCWLVITDHAGGMPKDELLKVFDPFYSTKDNKDHSGLGLTACLEIIKGFGGTLYIDSVEKSGTSIHIFLPAVAAEKIAVTETLPVKTKFTHSDTYKNILVLYPEEIAGRSIERLAHIAGANVVYAGNAHEAFKALDDASKMIDAVIMDWNLPEMDGFDVCVKFIEMNPNLRIMIASEEQDRDEILGIFRNQANVSYVEKPFRRQDLHSIFAA